MVLHLKVEPNGPSHENCLNKLNSFKEGELVIFLGHGRSDTLFGSKSDDYGALIENDGDEDNNLLNYYNNNFINKDNAYVFNNKKVICLACNSNSDISKFAIEGGAKSFIGFGDIPTSEDEFREHKIIVGDKTIAIMKYELNMIMIHSLSMAINLNYTNTEFRNLLYLVTNKRMFTLITKNKGLKTRRVISDFLFKFKNGLNIRGEREIHLIN